VTCVGAVAVTTPSIRLAACAYVGAVDGSARAQGPSLPLCACACPLLLCSVTVPPSLFCSGSSSSCPLSFVSSLIPLIAADGVVIVAAIVIDDGDEDVIGFVLPILPLLIIIVV
jgi:hypothetical protein